MVLRGPARPITLREKQKIAGIWINADSTDFRSVPVYYAIASSRPLSSIVDSKTAAIYELGLDRLQLSPSGEVDAKEQRRFSSGLVDLKQRNGLFRQEAGAVEITDQVLYRARLQIPSSVPVGTYVAETLVNFTREKGLSNDDFRKNGKSGPGTLARIYAINEDTQGNLWIGTADAGVWRFDGVNLTNFTMKDGLTNDAVSAIYKDKKGELWFGTEGRGVCKFNGTRFTTHDFQLNKTSGEVAQ